MAYEFVDEPQGKYEFVEEPKQAFIGRQNPREVMVSGQQGLGGVARGLKDPIDAMAQMLEKVLPQSVNDVNRSVNNWIANKTGMLAELPSGGVDELIKKQESEYQADRAQRGEYGLDAARLLGNVVNPVNYTIASKMPVAASLFGRMGIGALGGGLSGILNPVYGDNFAEEKVKQAGLGAAFGGAVPVVTGAISRVISPNASVNQQVAMLKSEGVKPTIGQTLGGWANAVEEKAQSLPIVGDAITYARNKAKEQFNNAAINRATAPIGVKVQGAGQSAVADASEAVSNAYNKADAMLGGFTIDQTAKKEFASLAKMVSALPKNERTIFNNNLQNIKTATPTGVMLADTYGTLKSKIGKEAADFSGSNDAYQKKLGDALSELQSIMVNNAKRSNPTAGALRDKADEAFANLVRVQGASVGAKGTEGVFTPGQLLTAVRGADKSVRDNATSQGAALMQDLGNAGQSVLGNKVPNSGTADRMMLGGAGLGTYLVNPAIPTALIAGAAGYSPPVQSLLRWLVSSRGQSAQPIAESVRNVSPYLIPSGAGLGLGLLNQ